MVPGKYTARAVGAALGFTSKGREQIAAQFEITEGEFAGRTLTWYSYFTPDTTERTLESLRHCGWKGDDLSKFSVGENEGPACPDGFGSTDVELVVEEKEYEGKVGLNVRWVNRLGAGLALKSKMDKSQAAVFAAKMKGAAVASRQRMGAPAPDAARPGPAKAAAPPARVGDVLGGDDIPF